MNKKWVRFIMVIFGVALIMLPGIVNAVYIANNSNKQVVVSGVVRASFSGDYMQIAAPSKPTIIKTIGDTDISIGIYNYPYGIKTEYNDKYITYTIKFTIETEMLEDQAYTVTAANGTETPFPNDTKVVQFNDQLLKGKEVSECFYTLKIPASTIVSIEATPNSSLNLPTLYGKIQKVIRSASGGTAVNIAWGGKFVYDPAVDPGKYAAFNYAISGSGKGVYSLKWNHDKLTIDTTFKNSLTGTITETTDGVWSTLSFSVDAGVQEMYNVRFYKNGITNTDTWETINSYIDTTSCYTEQ